MKKANRGKFFMGRNSIFSLSILFLLCIFSECFAAEVTQKTMGKESPNIYAPNARKVSVTYGVSEQSIINLLNQVIEHNKQQEETNRQLQEKVEIIDSNLKDMKDKNSTPKEMEAKIQDLTTAAERLNKQLFDSPSVKQITALKALTPYEFLDNSVIFHSYIQYRKTLQLLNPDMLIKLLDVYFRSVLLYPSSSQTKYYITAPDGRLMLLQFEGHNEKGEKISISLPDMSASLLQDVCWDFIKSADSKHYELMENLLDRARSTPELDKNLKIKILDTKNSISKNRLFLNK